MLRQNSTMYFYKTFHFLLLLSEVLTYTQNFMLSLLHSPSCCVQPSHLLLGVTSYLSFELSSQLHSGLHVIIHHFFTSWNILLFCVDIVRIYFSLNVQYICQALVHCHRSPRKQLALGWLLDCPVCPSNLVLPRVCHHDIAPCWPSLPSR